MDMLPRLGVRGLAALHRICGRTPLTSEDRRSFRGMWRLLREVERAALFGWQYRVPFALVLAPLVFLLAVWNGWHSLSYPPSLVCASLAIYAGVVSLRTWILEQDVESATGIVVASSEVVLILALRWLGPWWYFGCPGN